jgi:molybdenum cofactor biosynthesis enzyme MoaA
MKLCHVPGCVEELEPAAKSRGHGPSTIAYSFRYRVCSMHLRSESVQFADGVCRRFCQKCSRWRVAARAAARARRYACARVLTPC